MSDKIKIHDVVIMIANRPDFNSRDKVNKPTLIQGIVIDVIDSAKLGRVYHVSNTDNSNDCYEVIEESDIIKIKVIL